jgi:hypothetical protein
MSSGMSPTPPPGQEPLSELFHEVYELAGKAASQITDAEVEDRLASFLERVKATHVGAATRDSHPTAAQQPHTAPATRAFGVGRAPGDTIGQPVRAGASHGTGHWIPLPATTLAIAAAILIAVLYLRHSSPPGHAVTSAPALPVQTASRPPGGTTSHQPTPRSAHREGAAKPPVATPAPGRPPSEPGSATSMSPTPSAPPSPAATAAAPTDTLQVTGTSVSASPRSGQASCGPQDSATSPPQSPPTGTTPSATPGIPVAEWVPPPAQARSPSPRPELSTCTPTSRPQALPDSRSTTKRTLRSPHPQPSTR